MTTPATPKLKYEKQSIFKRLIASATTVLIAQPESYLEGPNGYSSDKLSSAAKSVDSNINDTEAAYLDRHNRLLVSSAQESLINNYKAIVRFYLSLPVGLQLFAIAVIVFIMLVMLPSAVGVVLLLMESKTELIRFITICGIILFMAGAWWFIPL